MTTIAHYDDTLHRSPVIALWKDVFGYDTPHNAPGLVIDRKVAVREDMSRTSKAPDRRRDPRQALTGDEAGRDDQHEPR